MSRQLGWWRSLGEDTLPSYVDLGDLTPDMVLVVPRCPLPCGTFTYFHPPLRPDGPEWPWEAEEGE